MERGLGNLVGTGLRVVLHGPGNQPGSLGREERNQAGEEEPSFEDSAKGGSPDIRVRAVLQVVDQVQQDDRTVVLPPDLEDPFHRVTPAEQQLPLDLGQVPPSCDEPVHHGRTVRQAVPQDAVVDDPDRLGLVQLPFRAGGLQQQRCQPPVEARALPESNQCALQLGTAFDEISAQACIRVHGATLAGVRIPFLGLAETSPAAARA
ncbi:hypothetical protein AB0K51_23050 [Kitasatospora sp. NPDC049285]|uniref:hypothetical protein n=1 Tax=Kitasatospora sp. NPDC049285 TaxID=3157096 RepID=UPI00342134FA